MKMKMFWLIYNVAFACWCGHDALHAKTRGVFWFNAILFSLFASFMVVHLLTDPD